MSFLLHTKCRDFKLLNPHINMLATALQGTPTSKKKKIKKLKRVVHTVEKSRKRGAANQADSFAALQLLHDAQTFAENLFSKLQARSQSFETRLVLMQVC